MITDNLHSYWKAHLARDGEAKVFGDQYTIRKSMDDGSALRHFAKVWSTDLEPQLRQAPEIPQAQVQEQLEGKQKDFAPPGYQYRQFSVNGVPFIARLNPDANDTGICDQLWPLITNRDPARLSLQFSTPAEKQQFDALAKRLCRNPKDLALELAMDFMRKCQH